MLYAKKRNIMLNKTKIAKFSIYYAKSASLKITIFSVVLPA